MTHTEIEALASELFIKHKLVQMGWRFEFDNAKRRLGHCMYRRRLITLSQNFTPKLSYLEVKDVILHEIAHVLAGAGNGHNYIWKQIAIQIGCNGERLYCGEVKVARKFKGVCPSCGREIHRHRRNTLSCSKCGNGSFNEKYLFVWSING